MSSARRGRSSQKHRSENGSRQAQLSNPIRHALTFKAVIAPLEDPEDYEAFEQAVTADDDAENGGRA